MTLEQPLAALWPKVRVLLPPAPGTVVELGCGRHGGFVPALEEAGYRALGIDPVAPEGERYVRAEFERTDVPGPVDVVLACTSLHHVVDPAAVLDKVERDLGADGLVVVVEWDWEGFDAATAQWCFGRLGAHDGDTWLHRHHAQWAESGQGWDSYLRGWAGRHGLHGSTGLVRELDRRFERIHCARGAYLFAELADTTEADELQAIEAGDIRSTRIDYVGRVRYPPGRYRRLLPSIWSKSP